MAAPVQTQNQVPKGPVRAKFSNLWQKMKARSERKEDAVRAESHVTRRGALKSMAALLGLSVVTACAPALVHAEPKDPTSKPKETAKKESKGVTYETFSDPKELEPYFKNAEGKFVKIKPLESKRVGDYTVTLIDEEGAIYAVQIEEGPEKGNRHSVALSSRIGNGNILAIEMGDSNPYIKGTMIVFADSDSVYFQYYRKVGYTDSSGEYIPPGHSLRGVSLRQGGMREGPIRTGYEIDPDGGIHIVNTPESLKPEDVITMANLWNNGDSGGQFLRYKGPEVDLIAIAPKGKAQS